MGTDYIIITQQYSVNLLDRALRGVRDPELSTFSFPRAFHVFEEVNDYLNEIGKSAVIGVYRRIIFLKDKDENFQSGILDGRHDKEILQSSPLEINGPVNPRLVQVGYSPENLTRDKITEALGTEKDRVNVADYYDISYDNPELRDYILTLSYCLAKNLEDKKSRGFNARHLYLFNSAIKVRNTNGLEKSVNEPLKIYISKYLN